MGVLLLIVVSLVVAVLPVMIGARIVGAGNTGFGAAVLAVILTVLTTIIGFVVFGQTKFVWILTAIIGGMILAKVLDTTFWRGIGVSIISVVIQFLMVLLLGVGGALMGKGMATA